MILTYGEIPPKIQIQVFQVVQNEMIVLDTARAQSLTTLSRQPYSENVADQP